MTQILLTFSDWLSLLSGLAGTLLSLVLLFYPGTVRDLSRRLNRWIGTEALQEWLDRPIPADRWFYRHHRAAGGAMAVASLWTLASLTAGPEAFPLADPGTDGVLTAGIWLGRISGGLGALFGLGLLFAPKAVRSLEASSSGWVDTRVAASRLDAMHPVVDDFFFRHPVPAGLAGLAASAGLTILAVVNLLSSG